MDWLIFCDPNTVGIQKPDMSGFRMVDHVWISNGVRISNGWPFFYSLGHSVNKDKKYLYKKPDI